MEEEQIFNWRDYLKHFSYPKLHTSDNPQFTQMLGNFKETRKLALWLMGLGLKLDSIQTVIKNGFQSGTLNLYPPCPEPDQTMGFSPRSDHRVLNILQQNDVRGRQVLHEGNWVAIDPSPNTFIVNVGDRLEILSNGRYKSVEYKAVVNAK